MVINNQLLSNLAFTVTHLQRKSRGQDITVGLKAKRWSSYFCESKWPPTKTCPLTRLVESSMFSIGVWVYKIEKIGQHIKRLISWTKEEEDKHGWHWKGAADHSRLLWKFYSVMLCWLISPSYTAANEPWLLKGLFLQMAGNICYYKSPDRFNWLRCNIHDVFDAVKSLEISDIHNVSVIWSEQNRHIPHFLKFWMN